MAERTAFSRAKPLTLAVLAASALLGVAAATQPWFTLTLDTTASGADAVSVPGTTAASALTALSLAALALTGALAIGGRIARIVLGCLGVVLGGSIVYSAVVALEDPAQAGSSTVTAKTGISGEQSIAHLVTGVDTTLWPAMAIAAGALVLVVSCGVLITGRTWPGPSKKYRAVRFEQAAPVGEDDPAHRRDRAIDDWDDLSRGDDPTG